MKLLAIVVLLVTVCSLEGEFVIRRKETKGKKVLGLLATQLSVLLQMSVPTEPKKKIVPFRKSKKQNKTPKKQENKKQNLKYLAGHQFGEAAESWGGPCGV